MAIELNAWDGIHQLSKLKHDAPLVVQQGTQTFTLPVRRIATEGGRGVIVIDAVEPPAEPPERNPEIP